MVGIGGYTTFDDLTAQRELLMATLTGRRNGTLLPESGRDGFTRMMMMMMVMMMMMMVMMVMMMVMMVMMVMVMMMMVMMMMVMVMVMRY